MKTNILYQLRTLKSHNEVDQIEIIEALTKVLLDHYDQVESIIKKNLNGKIIKVQLSADKSKIIQLALISVAIGDLASIPTYEERALYLLQFYQLAFHFDISEIDIRLTGTCYQELEQLFHNYGDYQHNQVNRI